jgi:hypothetical protein
MQPYKYTGVEQEDDKQQPHKTIIIKALWQGAGHYVEQHPAVPMADASTGAKRVADGGEKEGA